MSWGRGSWDREINGWRSWGRRIGRAGFGRVGIRGLGSRRLGLGKLESGELGSDGLEGSSSPP